MLLQMPLSTVVQRVIPGNIIVGMGKDHTLFALKEGNVRFERHKLSGRKWVHADPKEGLCSSPHLCRYCHQTCCREPVMQAISIQPGVVDRSQNSRT